MNDQQWYYERDGKQAGPISWGGLMAGLKMGQITTDTRVWASHLPEWISLGECMRKETPTALPPPPSPSFSRPSNPSKPKTGVLGWVLGIVLAGILLPIVVHAVLSQTSRREQAAAEQRAAQIVMTGHFTSHPDPEKTIGQAVNGFFDNPEWQARIGSSANPETEGKILVIATGKIQYKGRESQARIQFIVNERDATFELQAFEIDGAPQNGLMKLMLINKMYE